MDIEKLIDQHLSEVVAEIEKVTDPLERVRIYQNAGEYLNRSSSVFRARRTAAMHQAHEKMNVAELTRALGMTRTRVYKLLDTKNR